MTSLVNQGIIICDINVCPISKLPLIVSTICTINDIAIIVSLNDAESSDSSARGDSIHAIPTFDRACFCNFVDSCDYIVSSISIKPHNPNATLISIKCYSILFLAIFKSLWNESIITKSSINFYS